ncbi:hypothetical protein GGX14DRAFT_555984 [Mycena pura]|uniref:Uncharacterized protein n=1 Tax=Mycena pura TaxID=153505 RepID=A0AAD7E4S6_9AGAR|nr:hypothetical protein GGX14DRAFT_555984 [Mycena pura]
MSAAAVLLFVSRRRPARPRHRMALLLLPFSTGRRRHWQFLELEATGATRCERAGRHRQAARRRWRKAPDARAMRLCLEYVHSTILSTDLDDTQRLPAQTRLNIGSAAPILAFSLLQLLQTQASPQTRHRTHQPKHTPKWAFHPRPVATLMAISSIAWPYYCSYVVSLYMRANLTLCLNKSSQSNDTGRDAYNRRRMQDRPTLLRPHMRIVYVALCNRWYAIPFNKSLADSTFQTYQLLSSPTTTRAGTELLQSLKAMPPRWLTTCTSPIHMKPSCVKLRRQQALWVVLVSARRDVSTVSVQDQPGKANVPSYVPLMIPSRQGRGARAAGRGVPRCVGCARAAKPEWRMPQRATCWTPLRRATTMMRTWQGRGRSCTWRMRVLAPACAVMDAARWAASHGRGARVCAEPDASGGVHVPACHVFMLLTVDRTQHQLLAGPEPGVGLELLDALLDRERERR